MILTTATTMSAEEQTFCQLSIVKILVHLHLLEFIHLPGTISSHIDMDSIGILPPIIWIWVFQEKTPCILMDLTFVTVHHWYNNINNKLDTTITILLIISIISTCFER